MENNSHIFQQATDIIVESANRQGICLAERFGSVERFQMSVVALVLMTATEASGMELGEVIDLLFGRGTSEQIVERTRELIASAREQSSQE